MICPHCKHDQSSKPGEHCLICAEYIPQPWEDGVTISDAQLDEARGKDRDINITIQMPPPVVIRETPVRQSHPIVDFIGNVFLAIGVLFLILLAMILF